MHLAIVEGPGSPRRLPVIVDRNGLVIDGVVYTPLDDLSGMMIIDADPLEIEQLREHGFELAWLS